MMKTAVVLWALLIGFLLTWDFRPAAQPVLMPEPVDVAQAQSYTDGDLLEVGRRENLMPDVIEQRLSNEEIIFLVYFHRSVLREGLRSRGDWDPVLHIADLNRYAFIAERLHRTSGRFEPGIVRRIYEVRGLTLMHLSNAEVAQLVNMRPDELIRTVKGRR